MNCGKIEKLGKILEQNLLACFCVIFEARIGEI